MGRLAGSSGPVSPKVSAECQSSELERDFSSARRSYDKTTENLNAEPLKVKLRILDQSTQQKLPNGCDHTVGRLLREDG
jgi:hypothetical protein